MNFLPNQIAKTDCSTSVLVGISLITLSGCQSLHATTKPVAVTPIATTTAPVTTTQQTTVVMPSVTTSSDNAAVLLNQQFTINGKIGVTTPQQAGSAFYVWSQQGPNFAIDIAGALNAGQTNISYNGQTATLTNEKGTINAATPEELLQRATGWQAPISQLPYWIQGQPAPSDNNDKKDNQNRLVSAQNGDWTAEFSYANSSDKMPSRLTARHPDGYKVVMTINRLS